MSALLSTSRLKSARACLRLHKLQFLERWRAVAEARALRFGTLLHRGLEAWWRAPAGTRLNAALAAALGEADPFDRVRAEVMLTGYDARWGTEQYEVLAVEREFVTDLINPKTGFKSNTWRLAGKIDAVVRDAGGRVLIVEHKTSSENIEQGSEYWRRLRMDGQVSVYYEGARSLGFDVGGCLYDVLGKPAQRPLKATPPESRKLTRDGRLYANQRDKDETPVEFAERLVEAVSADPSAYYQRGEVVRLEAEMHEALLDIWQLGRVMREAELAGRAPRNPDACVRYGRTCEFFDVCTGVASLDDQTKFERMESAHPELSSALTASLAVHAERSREETGT